MVEIEAWPTLWRDLYNHTVAVKVRRDHARGLVCSNLVSRLERFSWARYAVAVAEAFGSGAEKRRPLAIELIGGVSIPPKIFKSDISELLRRSSLARVEQPHGPAPIAVVRSPRVRGAKTGSRMPPLQRNATRKSAATTIFYRAMGVNANDTLVEARSVFKSQQARYGISRPYD